MFVYTVRPNDSLYSISVRYDIPVDAIRAVNGLVNPNVVPGQSLLINQPLYIVQPGDSLYTISRMAYVPPDVLASANPSLNLNNLQPGMRVRIPKFPNYRISTLGYTVLQTPELDQALISDFAPYMTYVALFEYHFGSDGSLSQLNDQPVVSIARARHVAPLATITNLTESGFNPNLVREVLRTPAVRQNLINNIFNLLSSRGYSGVNIDFERVTAEDRDYYSDFLRRLGDRLKPAGYVMTIAVPAKTSEDIPWLLGYDYGAIGSVVDLMFIMAYDFHEAGSEPGPVAPIDQVRRTIEFALSRVPSRKILLGVPLYGYDWPLPYTPETPGTAISVSDAVELAMRYQVPIRYSVEYESPYFQYVDEMGRRHIVWFEEPRSMSEKMLLVYRYRLRGMGAWQLNLNLPQGPWLLTKFFTIRKVL
ncbi:glycosyl hydrolase family 18 protein [Aneurinibacillus tyrosinisolvens]|uniref:glycosyl hydrolase family 18 protein n=1 Tax=Aneurinibacillus tyrosinisolvens TaxID=1443435 RepID=UPI00063F2324|nr:glycosyl hydrolase family 18 protein [Aneurinibacillus tyrosinisolvens]